MRTLDKIIRCGDSSCQQRFKCFRWIHRNDQIKDMQFADTFNYEHTDNCPDFIKSHEQAEESEG